MRDKMKNIADFIRKNCQADDFTLRVNHSQDLCTRFAQNAITQHIDGQNLQIQLEAAFDNKTGSASTNQYDETALINLIEKAESIAKLNKPDPEFISSEKAHQLRELKKPAAATGELKVEKVVDDIKKCIENAQAKEAKISGISEKSLSETYLLTKNGFEGFDRSGSFSHSMTMKKGGIETKVSGSIGDYANFSMQKMIEQLNSQFDSLKEPQAIEKGKYPIIMRPQAVVQMMMYLIWTYQLREADEGINPYTNQIGEKFFGEHFTLRSTTKNPQLTTPLFSGHGIPTKDTDWILNGVIKNMQCDRYYASQKGIEPASAFNYLLEGGETSEEEMMKKVKRGLILNNLWYIRPIDMKTGEWTGLTRDGVLYFEDGEIKNAVVNLRWNEIFHDCTKRILALGPAEQIEHNVIVPTLLIDDFNFVDVTTF